MIKNLLNIFLIFFLLFGSQLNAGMFKNIKRGVVSYGAVKALKSETGRKVTKTMLKKFQSKKKAVLKYKEEMTNDSKIKQNIRKKQKQDDYNVANSTNATSLSDKAKKDINDKVINRTATKQEVKSLERSNRISAQRKYAVDEFWKDEKSKILSGAKTKREYTTQQKKDIISGKTPTHNGEPIEGHHTYSVKDYPQQANDKANIYPATKPEHISRWHGGKFQNQTSGKPLNPNFKEEF